MAINCPGDGNFILRASFGVSSFFFLMWIIFKVFFEFVMILLLFFFFWWKGMQDLSFIPCIGSRSPKHWTAREVPGVSS